jgi:hypothetical protein
MMVGHRTMRSALAMFCMMAYRFFVCDCGRMECARGKGENKNQTGD